eukprot:4960744-Amphidinium_carterae.1
MAAAILQAAEGCGAQILRQDGVARFSGHSLRVEGAQMMSRSGMDVSLICLFGRWGSSAVL